MTEEERLLERYVTLEPGQSFKHLGSKRSERKGQDTDYDLYAVLDADGEEVERYLLTDSMSIYPPQTRRIKVDAVGLNGTLPSR